MFGTSGIRGPVGESVTADLALSVGRAVATEGPGRVVLGRDPRATGEWLGGAVAAGLRECGADVIDLGMVSTPTLARSVAWNDADTGVMITASHNPAPDNGIKLWNPSGQAYTPDQCHAVERRMDDAEYTLRRWDATGRGERDPRAADQHVAALVDRTASLPGLSVVVDVGNGAAGLTARALSELGAEVRVLNATPDGSFPGRPSEPTAENCEALSRVVADSDADLGIAHDGDGDRMRAATESGRFVPGDVLLALFGRMAAGTGERIAAPIDTSLAVDEVLESVGASVTRTRVGDVFVAERATEADVVFGGEPSGAWIWPEETLCPDGPLAACRLAELIAAEGSFDALADEVPLPELRRGAATVEESEKADLMARVERTVEGEYGDEELTTIDGVHVAFDDGWILVRPSGTEPKVRVTAEAHDSDRAEELFSTAESLVGRPVS
ncbi:phosphoglucosamine mutase [Natronorarus salvus]|uniref:phosphoglucosamine mutase n=1 Tax=Natronorarus salvus TaxID=3117733 RepID=UPI0039081639